MRHRLPARCTATEKICEERIYCLFTLIFTNFTACVVLYVIVICIRGRPCVGHGRKRACVRLGRTRWNGERRAGAHLLHPFTLTVSLWCMHRSIHKHINVYALFSFLLSAFMGPRVPFCPRMKSTRHRHAACSSRKFGRLEPSWRKDWRAKVQRETDHWRFMGANRWFLFCSFRWALFAPIAWCDTFYSCCWMATVIWTSASAGLVQ